MGVLPHQRHAGTRLHVTAMGRPATPGRPRTRPLTPAAGLRILTTIRLVYAAP